MIASAIDKNILIVCHADGLISIVCCKEEEKKPREQNRSFSKRKREREGEGPRAEVER